MDKMNGFNLIIDTDNIDFIIMLAELMKKSPEIFNDNLKKLSCLIAFPYCIWSYEQQKYDFIPYENIESLVNDLEDNNIDLYYKFENTQLCDNNFYDRYSNLMLEIANKEHTFAVVYNEKLAQYIKNKYDGIKLVKSDIDNETEIKAPFEYLIINVQTYQKLKEKQNFNEKYILKILPLEQCNKEQIDILSINKINFELRKNTEERKIKTIEDLKKNNLFINTDLLKEIHKNKIEKFLIKTDSQNIYEKIDYYLYYLIKPEFIDKTKLHFLKQFLILSDKN